MTNYTFLFFIFEFFFMKFGRLKWSCSWSMWILNWNNWSNKVSELKKDFQDLSKNYRKYYPNYPKWWVINYESESTLIYCDGLHGERQTWTWTRGSLTLPRTSKGQRYKSTLKSTIKGSIKSRILRVRQLWLIWLL